MQDNVRNLTNTRESQAETAAASRNVYQLFKHKKDCTWNTPLATGQGTWGCNCGLDNLLLELEDFELTDLSAPPRPRCPKCSYGSGEDESLPLYPPGAVAPDIAVICPRCKFDVRVEIGEEKRDFAHLADFAQFFAAAPAQEPRQVRNLDEIDESHIAAQEQPIENSRTYEQGVRDAEQREIKAIREGCKAEICSGCDTVLLAHKHFVACQKSDCPMKDGKGSILEQLLLDSPQKGKP